MFETEGFSKDYNEWLELKEQLEKKHREIVKFKKQEFNVALNHGYLTSGKDIEVIISVASGLKTHSNYNENWDRDGLFSGTVPYKYFTVQQRPCQTVLVLFQIAAKSVQALKDSTDFKLLANCNPEFDQSWYIDGIYQLPEEDTKEYNQERNAMYNERNRDGLAYKLLQTSSAQKEKELDLLVRDCNLYLAEILYKNVITKIFSEEQFKKYFHMSEIPDEKMLYRLIAGKRSVEIPFGKDLYER